MSQRFIFLDGSKEKRSTDYTQGMLTDILQAIAKNSSAENISQVWSPELSAFLDRVLGWGKNKGLSTQAIIL